MFPQFGSTADNLSKASTMVFRIGTDAHLYDDPEDVNILPLLDSKFDSEKSEALKRLLALIAQGLDVSNFFPQVVKNVASQSLEVKKLVYLYLLHYAEKRPDEALLSINCFQRDLGDTNPLVRAWALRTMAGIRLRAIAPLVLVAVQKGARDPSVYVRKCAAGALPKLHDLRLEEYTSTIEEIIGILLNDHSPAVVGAAASAFASVCSNNFSLIGRNFKRLCEILPDVEEWGQIVLIGILLRYAIGRHGLVKESVMFSLHKKETLNLEIDNNDVVSEEESGDECVSLDCKLANMVAKCYIEGPDEYLSRSMGASESSDPLFTSGKNNDDVKILLQCTSPLLWSNNSAVVLAAAGIHWIMAPKKEVKKIVKPLLFVLRSSYPSKYVVLSNIQVFAKAMPSLFAPHFEDFFVSSSDSHQVKALKLEILSCIATDSSSSSIFREFQDYVRDPDRRFAADAVNAIGLCACRLPKVANMWLNGLLMLTRQGIYSNDFVSVDEEAGVLVQALTSIKSIIEQDPPGHEKAIIQLIRSLDSIKVSAARAIVIWMVGEYNSVGDVIRRMLATLLKYLAHCFTSEALETKLQILNTTVKVLLHANGEDLWMAQRVLSYLLELAECDLNYDVRDRARFLKNVLSCKLESQGHEEEGEELEQHKDLQHKLAEHIISGEVRSVPSQPMKYRFYLPGSLSQLVLHAAPGYESLPKPCSLDISEPNLGQGMDTLCEDTNSRSYDTDDDESVSESFDEESDADYSSRGSDTGSTDNGEGNGTASETNDYANNLIQLSDNDLADINADGVSESGVLDMGEFMSKGALESWLGEQPGDSNASSSRPSPHHKSTARISLGNVVGRVKPKKFTLLQPANGKGLKVDYMFSSEISSVSTSLVCIEIFFENCSSEPLSDIELVDEESDRGLNSVDDASSQDERFQAYNNEAPTTVPMEKILSLRPGQTTNKTLQVRFHHLLLPLKLVLTCNGEEFPVKLWPDIGYFVKPLQMDIANFTNKESTLRGMFEYTRRCTFTDHLRYVNTKEGGLQTRDSFLVICESLALKMLSNANLFLVSVDLPVATNFDDASGLRLRFSSEILSNSMPCLITITIEGNCSETLNASVKVNCEETVFGLNFLNRVVSILVEETPAEL